VSELTKQGRLLALAAASLIFLAACGQPEAPPGSASLPAAMSATGQSVETEAELVARARGIHERVIVMDTHVDINTANFTPEVNYLQELNTQVNLPKMEQGGMDAVWLIVYTGQGPLTPEGYASAEANAMDKFGAIHRLVTEIAPDQIELATTSADVRRIVAAGKRVAMIGVENAYPLGEDLSKIKDYYDMGARYISLSHNGHSQFSDSNTGERDDVWLHNGLSELGRQAIAEMNRLGIMIDISHPSMEANRQTIELSRAPVIASHSSARALDPTVSRNLWDEELLAVKENGGVVQAVAFRSYVNSAKHLAFREAGGPPVDVSDFVDHIDYMVNLLGIDYVGISGDFDGGGGVTGWVDAAETFNVTLELVRRGYTEEDIAKIWGGNVLRVLDDVQRIAAQIQAEQA